MVFISNDAMKSTFIFSCTIHQTLPVKRCLIAVITCFDICFMED